MTARACWCGADALTSFSPEYRRCADCGTLVSQVGLTAEQTRVKDDEEDFYGKQYWLAHQRDDLGFPDIQQRADTELAERCLHWLRTLLKYKLPPAKTLELGSAHGGFVALMRWAGFDATGLELSPWVVEFARRTFGVPMLAGPVETQNIEPASLDAIALMDVMEHLPDPVATLRHCLDLLRHDGVLVIQTPCTPEGKTYAEMVAEGSPFLEQLKSDEHLYLFSQAAIVEFFRRLGAVHIQFEPAIFADYDMYLVVGRAPLAEHSEQVIGQVLRGGSNARLVQALLDIDGQLRQSKATLRESEADRAARLGQIETLTGMLRESETDRAARGQQVETLTGMLQESESDRAARGQQVETLTGMLQEAESDRAARGEQIGTLTGMLQEAESDRAARGEQIGTLTEMLRESESDRAARGQRIEALEADLRVLFSRSAFRLLTRLIKWPEVRRLAQQHESAANGLHKALRTIAVDLTPVLPGGENGGAKVFVLELLRRLAEMAPQTEFVLLTQAVSHEELAALDRPNMRRVMVVGPVMANTLRPRLQGVAKRVLSHVLPHFPGRLRREVYRLGSRMNAALKRGSSGALLRNMGADLLFCPFTAPTYFEPGIPTVCTIYDLQYKTYPEFFSPEDVAHRDRTFVEACRRASALTAISDYSRDSAIAHGNLDPAGIRTIHLRMAQRISPGAEHDRRVLNRLGLAPQRYLIYPANFWKHKNHEMLLTAFGMACHEGVAADVKLVCTGAPGARQEWLMRAARAMKLGDRVLFPGYLPSAELAALMADCSGVVFPSLYEGFGLPVIEAMASGVPVACSNTTSLLEVAADAAILFDPRIPSQIAHAMVSLVEDEALRARLIQTGKQRAMEFFDTQRMAREYWDLFQHALANEKHENSLTGVYVDGWAGPALNIQVAPADSAQSLEIEIFAPEWLPQSQLSVQGYQGGKPKGAALEIVRGANSLWTMPLEPAGGYCEVRITPTFVPARCGHGEDQRELSAIVQRCDIVHADGERIALFPEQVSA